MRFLTLLLALTACAADPTPDAAPLDATPADSGVEDRGFVDAEVRDADPIDAMVIDSGPMDAGTSTTACGVVAFSPSLACAECQVGHCCAVAQNCAGNPECQAAFDCQSQCADAACRRACQTTHAAGVWDFSGLYVCLQNNCSTECNFPAPVCGGINLTTQACNTCFRGQCCAEGTACGQSDQCLALIYQCLDKNGCPDSDGPCAQNCRTLYPEGAVAFDASLVCARAECPTECAGL